jgi:hypothetical protein
VVDQRKVFDMQPVVWSLPLSGSCLAASSWRWRVAARRVALILVCACAWLGKNIAEGRRMAIPTASTRRRNELRSAFQMVRSGPSHPADIRAAHALVNRHYRRSVGAGKII